MKLYWSQMVLLSALAILLLLPPSAAAQSAEELAKQTQNPIANLISVPLQANWDFGLGDRKAVGTVLNFQPVMPFSLNKSTNLILRVIMPMLSQPTPDGTRINGLGDVVMTAFFSPKKTGKVIWGVGPALLLPVATNNSFGSEKFGLGPSFVVLTQPGKFTVGLLFNSIWSVAGAKDRTDVSTSYLAAISELQPGKRTRGRGLLGNLGQLEGRREVVVAVAFFDQQGRPARQSAGEFRMVCRPDGDQPGRRRRMAVSVSGEFPVPTVTYGTRERSPAGGVLRPAGNSRRLISATEG